MIAMKNSVLKIKSKDFAFRIIGMYKYLQSEKRELILSKQLLRSGTSIGANICEASYAQSTADFISKLHISLKEAAESEYWIELLAYGKYISEDMKSSMLKDCLELIRILTASINTAKGRAN